jgi:hypothetical protein
MKTLLLTMTVLLTFNAFGSDYERFNQKKVDEMVAVLDSKEVMSFFNQTGALRSIDHMITGRAIFGPVNYKLVFRPATFDGPKCVARVGLDIRDNSVRSAKLICE